MPAELALTAVSVRLGRSDVVRDVSATIPPGTLCCILGPNGAGKSSLLRAITGYLPLTGGTITLGSKQLSSLASRDRARLVAMVPQLSAPVGSITAREAVMLGVLPGSTLAGDPDACEALADSYLQQLGLFGKQRSACDALSGGEWRKVLVAQGMMQQADVLLLDEPTAFLDPPARKAILRAARQYCATGDRIVVVVLHEPTYALEFADLALLMRRGQLIASGSPADTVTEQALELLYQEEMNQTHGALND